MTRQESNQTEQSVVIYTDGACSGNPGPAAAAATLQFGEKKLLVSQYLGVATNNIAELTAVKIALESMKNRQVQIDLHSDSTYVIGLLTKGWKAKENKELVAELREIVSLFPALKFHKVKGHAGVDENELVDKLAREAVENRKGVRLRLA